MLLGIRERERERERERREREREKMATEGILSSCWPCLLSGNCGEPWSSFMLPSIATVTLH